MRRALCSGQKLSWDYRILQSGCSRRVLAADWEAEAPRGVRAVEPGPPIRNTHSINAVLRMCTARSSSDE
eukprot:5923446-Prymnesium_polylepis.1